MIYSTRQAAKELGLHYTTMHKHLRGKKIPLPELTRVGGVRVRLWSESDLERVRKLLPKIANGRKTRHQKKDSAVSSPGVPRQAQQSAKPKKKKTK